MWVNAVLCLYSSVYQMLIHSSVNLSVLHKAIFVLLLLVVYGWFRYTFSEVCNDEFVCAYLLYKYLYFYGFVNMGVLFMFESMFNILEVFGHCCLNFIIFLCVSVWACACVCVCSSLCPFWLNHNFNWDGLNPANSGVFVCMCVYVCWMPVQYFAHV